MRHHCRALGLALISLLIFAVSGCDRIESSLIERFAGRALTGDRNDLLDDGNLHVVLCGTGSPLPDPERSGPCTAVLAGGHFLLVDVGPGAWRQVAFERLPRARLEAVLLTHFHSDHIGEVGEVTLQSWVAGRTQPLIVYGPPGVEQVVDGFRQAYALDAQYRIAHHGVAAMPPEAGHAVARTVQLPGPDDAALVFEADGVRVTAFAVDHAPVTPAYGYRVEYHGRSVVISGDTRKSNNLIRHAQGVDLLVHEALATQILAPVSHYAQTHGLSRWAKLTSDIVTYHTTPLEAAAVAKAANAHMLVLTHIVPPLPNFIARRMFLRGLSDVWSGETVLGKDGMHFQLSPGATSVHIDSFR